MANSTYIFNCGVNPITGITVNNVSVATGVPVPAWPTGTGATPAALTPITIGLAPFGSGTPSTPTLVGGQANSISITSQDVVYNGTNAIDLTKFSLQAANNMAMFIFFGQPATFGQVGAPGSSICQIVLSDAFGEFVQSYYITGGAMRM
jgi:hypothetical protein